MSELIGLNCGDFFFVHRKVHVMMHLCPKRLFRSMLQGIRIALAAL